jgi:hypothetical protein
MPGSASGRVKGSLPPFGGRYLSGAKVDVWSDHFFRASAPRNATFVMSGVASHGNASHRARQRHGKHYDESSDGIAAIVGGCLHLSSHKRRSFV